MAHTHLLSLNTISMGTRPTSVRTRDKYVRGTQISAQVLLKKKNMDQAFATIQAAVKRLKTHMTVKTTNATHPKITSTAPGEATTIFSVQRKTGTEGEKTNLDVDPRPLMPRCSMTLPSRQAGCQLPTMLKSTSGWRIFDREQFLTMKKDSK